MTPDSSARVGRPLITLQPGDPRRAAHLQHLRNAGEHAVASAIERQRLPLDVAADWPPETDGLETIDYGRDRVWFLPKGSPEWAAHVAATSAAHRKEGRPGPSAEFSAPDLIAAGSRWPVLDTQRIDTEPQGDPA